MAALLRNFRSQFRVEPLDVVVFGFTRLPRERVGCRLAHLAPGDVLNRWPRAANFLAGADLFLMPLELLIERTAHAVTNSLVS